MLRHPHNRPSTAQSGFSLVEQLAVLTIMALVLGAVMARSGGGVEHMRLAALAQHVSDELNRTRLAAIRSNREAVFTVNLEARSYGPPGAEHQIPKGVAVRLVAARRETSVDATAGGIRFFPDGTSTGGSVEMKKGGQVRLVRVDWLTGHVSIEESGAHD